jgi:putative phosphoribosyl transferase
MWRRFADRHDAGRQLAEKLEHLRGADVVVLGLARGGVVVAHEVAERLEAPLDVIVARKLGAPIQPELAIGAIAHGASVLRDDLVEMLGISDEEVAEITARERQRADELERRLRHGRSPADLAGKTAIVVDDGLATGATALAAVRSVRRQGPKRIVLAVPVAAPESVDALRKEADEVVTVLAPADLRAIGLWYQDFGQVEDAEVEAMLDERSAGDIAGPPGRIAGPPGRIEGHQPAGRER